MDNLSMEMIQCRKDGFGCHYGQWKAQQERKPIKPVKVETEGTKRICEYCGKEFVYFTKHNRKFCGDICRINSYYRYEKKGHAHGKSKDVGDE